MRSRTDPQAGFMLVEVLAALLVTAALVAAVLPFAGQLIARWQSGQASVLQADGWMRAIARLTDDVAEAMPLHETGRPTVLAFGVGARTVDFIRPALGSGGAAGLERVSYRAEAFGGGEKLVRRAVPVVDGVAAGGGSAVTLIEGPYTFRFAAVGRDGSYGAWADLNAMPLRLQLVVAGREGARVPFSPVTLPIAARATVAAVVPLLRQTTP